MENSFCYPTIERSGQSLGVAYGHFSSIHPGHIRYLKYAKQQADILVVIVTGKKDDPQSEFRYSTEERSTAVNLLGIADYIVSLRSNELVEALKHLDADIITLGNEHRQSTEPEISDAIKYMQESDKIVRFGGGDISYFSSSLLGYGAQEVVDNRTRDFRSACMRQGVTLEKAIEKIHMWKGKNVLVIGDTIVDHFIACEPVGMSAEAPVIVVKELESKRFVGGAGVVASHISAMGGCASFISVIGDDDVGIFAKNELNRQDVKTSLIVDEAKPTTYKTRYVADNQKLFRTSRLDDTPISDEIENQLIEKIKECAPSADVLIVSDFVYGVITSSVISLIKEVQEKYNILLLGDVQSSTQVGNVLKLTDYTLLCPNEKEARLALGCSTMGLERLCYRFMDQGRCSKLIMKLGSNGLLACHQEGKELKTQCFPALCANPVDVSGAGDSVLATMALGLESEEDFMTAAALSCCTASLAVEKMGNIPITSSELASRVLSVLG